MGEYLPARPLLEYVRAHADPDVGVDVAETCGVAGATVKAWRRGASLRATTADRVAIRLGVHPSAIWGLEWWQTT